MHTYPFTLLIVAMWLMSFKSAWWFTNHEAGPLVANTTCVEP